MSRNTLALAVALLMISGTTACGARKDLDTGQNAFAQGTAEEIFAAARADIRSLESVHVSGTVRDLVAGSRVEFHERGAHALPGVPGEWRLFSAR